MSRKRKIGEKPRFDQVFLQSLIDSSPDIVQVFKPVRDTTGAIIDFVWVMNNKKAIEQNGEVIGKSLLQQNPGVVQTGIFNRMVQVAETGVAQEHEQFYNHEQFNGWFYQALVKAGDEVVMTTRDVTQRKKAEQEILQLKDELAQRAEGHKKAEDTLRQLAAKEAFILKFSDALRQVSDPMQIQAIATQLTGEQLHVHLVHYVETQGDYITINKAWSKDIVPIIGTFRYEFFGQQFNAGHHLGIIQVCYNINNDPTLPEAAKALLHRFNLIAYVTVPLIKDHEWVATLGVYCREPRQWKQSEIDLIEEIAKRTWTAVERAKAEEALKISEERYRAALHSADMAAWDWDTITDRVIWNERHFYLLGLEQDTEPQKADNFFRFVHPDDLQPVKEKLQKALEETGVYRAEFRIIRTDGTMRWMSGYGRAIQSRDGKVTRMVGVMYDITEQKQIEQQKEEFIGIASHELKTPVTSIKIYAETLLEKFEKAGHTDKAELMQKLNDQVNRLTSLIKDLLDTTRISDGKLPLYPEQFDMNELMRERIEELQRISKEHQLVLHAGPIGPVTADRERIGQVITNLISNAIKYSPDGGKIMISTRALANDVEVQVQDSGIGIPASQQDKVFRRFFRVTNSPTHTYPGMGLGLYICEGIIHRHGGAISLQSKEGEGSTFSFTLPCHNSG